MKVVDVRVNKSTCHFVEVDTGFYPEYRRWSADCWEQRMGESWESVYGEEQLEKAFIQYLSEGMSNSPKDASQTRLSELESVLKDLVALRRAERLMPFSQLGSKHWFDKEEAYVKAEELVGE